MTSTVLTDVLKAKTTNGSLTISGNGTGNVDMKNLATTDDTPMVLTLQTGETDMAANDIIGAIQFQAPDEGTGTDAILVSAAIKAYAEGDFSSSSNATTLGFYTGSSEAAAIKMSLSSGGNLDVTGTIQGSTITAETAFVPDASDGAALGTTALEFSDLFLADGAVINFGDDQEITLTHVADTGLTLKHAATADDKYPTLTLQTGDTDIASADKLGVINFQAPDEGAGTDAILVAAGIEAVSEGDFSSSNNATKLSFKTASTAAAAETMSLSSGGNLTIAGVATLDNGSVGAPSVNFGTANTGFYASGSSKIDVAIAGALDATFSADLFALPVGTNFAFGHTSILTSSINGNTPEVQLNSIDSGIFEIVRWQNAAAGPSIHLGSSRGATVGADVIVQDDDPLGTIRFGGDDGGDMQPVGALIQARVDGTPGVNDMPTELVFGTTADGAQTPTDRLTIGPTGLATFANEVSMPTQPAFRAKASGGDQNNVSGDGTTYTILFATEVFDQGSDFANPTFTAPVTGKYLCTGGVLYTGQDTSQTALQLRLVTSNRTILVIQLQDDQIEAANQTVINFAVLTDFDAADTASITFTCSGTNKTVDIQASEDTFFSAVLIV
jgi:hypothetical protein